MRTLVRGRQPGRPARERLAGARRAGGWRPRRCSGRRPTRLYAVWNVDVDGDGAADGPWHLGTAAQYPAQTLDVDGDGRAGWQELARQLRAGPELTAVPTENPAAANLAEVALTWTAAFTCTVRREAGAAGETVATGDAARQHRAPAVKACEAERDGPRAPRMFAVRPRGRKSLESSARGYRVAGAPGRETTPPADDEPDRHRRGG